MNQIQQLLTECELDSDALEAKLRRAAEAAGQHDPHARRRLVDMADWLGDVAQELSELAGHPRRRPDYAEEVAR